MRGSLDRDVSRVRMSRAQNEPDGIYLALHVVAWAAFLGVVYGCCSLAVGWSLT